MGNEIGRINLGKQEDRRGNPLVLRVLRLYERQRHELCRVSAGPH